MNEQEKTHEELLDTTDCLEAVGVFKSMKNLFFFITLICLLILQATFWIVDRNYVFSAEDCGSCESFDGSYISIPLGFSRKSSSPEAPVESAPGKMKEIAKAAEESTKGIEARPDEAASEPAKAPIELGPEKTFDIDYANLAWIIRLCNFALVFTLCLYMLSLMFSLKVSLLGRLGGINHIARAFFLSLFGLVLVLPWQMAFDGIVAGAIYTPKELLCAVCGKCEQEGLIGIVLYYGRYVGLWFLVLLLIILAQIRSGRWSKATLRRLGIG